MITEAVLALLGIVFAIIGAGVVYGLAMRAGYDPLGLNNA